MRILTLHGVGSSGAMLQRQLSAFLQATDPSYEWVFVDAPIPCWRGPGIDVSDPGPFYANMVGYSPVEIEEALKWLADTIEDLGPFDGVLGFSQGGSLALSYMHSQQSRGVSPDFRFAILFSSIVPFSSDSSYCLPIIESLMNLKRSTTSPEEERIFADCLTQTFRGAKQLGAVQPDFDEDFFGHSYGARGVPRILHSKFLGQKLRIPTVHIIGKRDFAFMRDMSEVARGICDARLARTLEHSGGHYPPRTSAEAKVAAKALDWAVRQAMVLDHVDAHL